MKDPKMNRLIGYVVLFIGVNGAGKSTLYQAIDELNDILFNEVNNGVYIPR